MIESWKILKSRDAFRHQWCHVRQDVVQLPDGRIIDDYFVSVRHDIAVMFAVTPDFQVPLVRQYKHGVQKVLLELPGGFVDCGEAPAAAAQRELLEETGYAAESVELLTRSHDNPTKSTETIHLYLAHNVVNVQEQDLDEYEHINVELVPVTHLHKLVLAGEIAVTGSIAGIYLGLHRLGLLKSL